MAASWYARSCPAPRCCLSSLALRLQGYRGRPCPAGTQVVPGSNHAPAIARQPIEPVRRVRAGRGGRHARVPGAALACGVPRARVERRAAAGQGHVRGAARRLAGRVPAARAAGADAGGAEVRRRARRGVAGVCSCKWAAAAAGSLLACRRLRCGAHVLGRHAGQRATEKNLHAEAGGPRARAAQRLGVTRERGRPVKQRMYIKGRARGVTVHGQQRGRRPRQRPVTLLGPGPGPSRTG